MLLPVPNVETDPSRRKVAILANPRAGPRTVRRPLDDLVENLRSRDLQPCLFWERGAFSDFLKQEAASIRCVVAAGGDGTLNDVHNLAPGLPVSVLALGNENLLARYCGLGRSGKTLADIIVANRLKRFDLASAQGRLFALMAGVGLDAEVVHQVHRRRRGHINKLHYIWAILRTLHDYSYPEIGVEIGETGEHLKGAIVFVFNFPKYGLGLPLARQARPDDGWLDLFVYERPGLIPLLRYLDLVVRGKHLNRPDIHHRRVKCVRLFSAKTVPLQLDGDPAGILPATIEVVPGAMRLLVPEGSKEEVV